MDVKVYNSVSLLIDGVWNRGRATEVADLAIPALPLLGHYTEQLGIEDHRRPKEAPCIFRLSCEIRKQQDDAHQCTVDQPKGRK